ncbi:MobF family relaxase [Gluconobacter kondonii]|uniref:MobF family relaxase n=1 Tax=Gluconobacter kondonii TaxID=941463 RepID=UPI001B8CB2A4|nr:MobF family relaxase [Gluconobacter kondonii]MBS1054754.1 relaxase domain-containing protein [Gluconobacter kondonii]
MFTCSRISSVEYYLAENDADERDRAAYYLDNGAEEDKGVWWTNARLTRENKKLPLVDDGTEVKPRDFRELAAGRIPISGKMAVQSSENRSVGYDMQFAAPKSVSVLWASADDDNRKRIEEAQRNAVMSALNYAHDNGFITTRRGKGGAVHEKPQAIQAATFQHTTSRAGDPQLHTHAVMMNVCRREDGTFGTIDNSRLLMHKQEMGAVYRLKLAEELEKTLGVSISKDGRNFEVDGIPSKVCENFSKRVEDIKRLADERGIDKSTNRVAAEFMALETRGKKSELPTRDELKERWSVELKKMGWTKQDIFDFATSIKKEDEVSEYETPALKAIAEISLTDAAIEERKLLGTVMEEWQGKGTLEDALNDVQMLKDAGILIEVGHNENGAVYATEAMIEKEKSLLRNSIERKAERDFVHPDAVEAAIKRRETMSEEQAEAVRHALNKDGVSVLEGSAGTGKSYSLGAVADAARETGLRVHVIAPSHKAKDVLRTDTASKDDDAQTVSGFINRTTNERHKEFMTLGKDDCIIVDEAGMCGTSDIDSILRTARAAGCKVILAGDTKQLQPVAAGSPMSAIAETCGTQRISEIRRQRTDWQREASMKFAVGDTTEALQAYDKKGCIRMSGYQDALTELVTDYRQDITNNPDKTRIVLATTNKDVGTLNEKIREQVRDAGMLHGEDISVPAMGRGRNAKARDMSIAEGDRLIFGESVLVDDKKINNSDTCTVLSISGEGPDARVKLQFDKGITVDTKWSDLAQKDRDGERGDVKCQHAYAVTVHASQGVTVNNAYVFNGNGIGQEAAYVAMTRHKDDVKMYVNADRLERNAGDVFSIDSSGRTDGRDADEIPTSQQESTRDILFSEMCRESSRKTNKVNVSDFVEDRKSWAGVSEKEKKEMAERERSSRLQREAIEKAALEKAAMEHESKTKRAGRGMSPF